MRLKVHDQIAVSMVKPDSLRRGEEFEVSDAFGAELLAKHPATFSRLDDAQAQLPAKADAAAPSNKMEPAPGNKAARQPARKPKRA